MKIHPIYITGQTFGIIRLKKKVFEIGLLFYKAAFRYKDRLLLGLYAGLLQSFGLLKPALFI